MLERAMLVEIDPDDYTDEFEEMLDECYGDFMGYAASDILKEVDPTAYRCGLLDYVDSLAIEKWECPMCHDHHDDEDDATYCCQDEDEEDADDD